MIKMDNVSETSDLKSEVSRSYLNIKPKEKMSDQEAADFISKEFEEAHEVAEFDTYDKLLSEAFPVFIIRSLIMFRFLPRAAIW
jgi:hypothetical protein